MRPSSPTAPRPARLAFALAALTALTSACGADDSGALFPGNDTTTPADTSSPDAILPDTTPADTSSPDATSDTGAPQDTGPTDTREETETVAPLFALKDDPTFLVPGNRAKKTSVAAAGSLVAWVESTDAAPVLVTWDLRAPDLAPRTYLVPNLANPRQLALSDAFLVYVDDRYGDPDVFAIELESGRERPVITGPGAQDHPTILGANVAWEDCRACVTGEGEPGREAAREIGARDLGDPAGTPRLVTTDASVDRAPRFGLLEDGRAALVWVSGETTLRVERLEAGLSRTLDLSASVPPDSGIAGAALVDGVIAWRPSPLIVNPDSMIVNPDSMWPSDVFLTDVASGDTTILTIHAELSGGRELAPDGLGTRLAWLESAPGTPALGRLRLVELASDPLVIDTRAELTGLATFAVGRDFVALTAPRADNDGEEDLHVLRLP